MTATFLLIRHASHDHLGRILTGRLPDIPLSSAGADQALALGRRLRSSRLDRVTSSPSLRARQTAQAVADGREIGVETHASLDEVDFGEWTGSTFDDLANDPRWQHWNSERAAARAPGGEGMKEAQARALGCLHDLAARHGGGTLAIVTHCDIIRAVIAEVIGLSLDCILRFDISPASVSRIVIGPWGGRVISVNEEVACPA